MSMWEKYTSFQSLKFESLEKILPFELRVLFQSSNYLARVIIWKVVSSYIHRKVEMDPSRSRSLEQLSDSNELVRKVTRKKKKKKSWSSLENNGITLPSEKDFPLVNFFFFLLLEKKKGENRMIPFKIFLQSLFLEKNKRRFETKKKKKITKSNNSFENFSRER